MIRTTITMIIKGKQISFETEVAHNEVQKEIDMFGPFANNNEAIEMFGKEIPSLEYLLVTNNSTPIKTEKKENPVTTAPVKETKTLVFNIILPGDLGKVGMSKEFLEKTGNDRDLKLIKKDKEGGIIVYDIPLMQLATKCSKAVAIEVEAYIAKEIAKIKKTELPKRPATEEPTFNPNKDGKKKAVDFMVQNLKEGHEGNWGEHVGIEGKAQWLADFTGHGFRKSTAEDIQMTTKGGVLYVHIPGCLYKTDRERWNNVLTAIRDACRKSRLEYQTVQNGKLPIKIRAMKRDETY